MATRTKPTLLSVWNEYTKGMLFNTKLELDETVQKNERYFIGDQWFGIQANGLPTPVFNFLKRVVLFTVAGITSDNIVLRASAVGNCLSVEYINRIVEVINKEFAFLFETNKIANLLREYMRNAAVDGSACLFTYWDEEKENGQNVPGGIVTEVIENTRVFFGNVNDRRVQKQPYIIISSREMTEDLKLRAKEEGCENWDEITTDTDNRNINPDYMTDDKTTVLLRLWRDRESKKIWCVEITKNAVIREPWDTGLSLYPVTWLNWDYVQDCYHGQAMITGLIPNQIFINKMYAMTMISLMTTAYPKVVFDATRIDEWDNRVGSAIPVNGGDVNGVAAIIDPAQVSPQIAQFIQMAIDHTQTFLGATSVALGDTRPDNTSAIIALQRAASTPSELTKQNLYESLEDIGRIYHDMIGEYYGERLIEVTVPKDMSEVAAFAGVDQSTKIPQMFDFDQLKGMAFSMKLDVGASSYWSEIASMQTLDNLLLQGKIDLVDYLERVPNGYISKQEELLDKYRGQLAQAQAMLPPPGGSAGGAGTGENGQVIATDSPTPIPTGRGYSDLQRKLNETGDPA